MPNDSLSRLSQLRTGQRSIYKSTGMTLADRLRARYVAAAAGQTDTPWKEEPVDFNTFVTSNEHMKFPPLSPKQVEAALAVLHSDPKKVFSASDRKYNVACCLWGKGSLACDEMFLDTLSGELRTVEDWSRRGNQIHVKSFDFVNRRLTTVRVDPPVLEDVGELFEVKTESRYTVRVNGDHKFYTLSGWKKLSELTVGTDIGTTFGLPLMSEPKFTKITLIKPIGVGRFYGLTVPETGNYLHNSLLHANSGKDSLAAIIICYMVYLLLCLKKPYMYLSGYDVPDEAIDIVNVAYSYDQASNVFFTKFRSRVKNWLWLRKAYRVRESGKDLDPKENKREFLADRSLDTVTIYPSAVMFPNMIRAFSRHSMVQSTEGLNLIAWVMDEASSMRDNSEKANAQALYEMLESSAQSRFPDIWAGMVLSYPRHKRDFTMMMYKDAIEGKLPRVFASKGATWEVNPTKTYEHFRSAIENPKTARDAKGKYACEPESQEAGFFDYPDKIKECVDTTLQQVAEFEKTYQVLPTGAKLIGKVVRQWLVGRQPDTKRYVARVDLGHVHDRASLVVGHLEGDTVIIDLITHWTAEDNIPIDVDDPAELIIKLKRELLNIAFCSYDQWNSLSSLNRLNRVSIPAARLSLNYEDWKLLKDTVYSRKLKMPVYQALNDPDVGELYLLQLLNGNRVDHPRDGHDDISQGLCGVVSMLLGARKNLQNVDPVGDHYQGNEESTMTSIWAPEDQYNQIGDDPFADSLSGVSAKLR